VPGRKLGQHFLNNQSILERLAEAACPSRAPLAIEIGQGRGSLTAHLLRRADRVIAVELDRGLAAGVRGRYPAVELVEADVLDTDLSQWGLAVVAGNLPYYITSPILERLYAMGPLLLRAVVLVQLEVAERLVAVPGTRDYGFLTVQTQLFTRPEILLRVPPEAFSPPPKVDSAAVLLTPREPPAEDVPGFLEFAGRCFRHKRKTLRNNLLPYCGRRVEACPEAGLRAEQLPLEGLIDLYNRLR